MKKIMAAGVMCVAMAAVAGDYQLKNAGFELKTGWDAGTKAHQGYAPDGATPAYEGNCVALCGNWVSGTGAYLTQPTDAVIKPGAEYRLSAFFAPRKDGQTRFGGYWLRLIADARESGGGRYTVALISGTEPVDDWTEKELIWKAPADLTAVPELHGLSGEPTGKTVDVTGAKLEILVGKKLGYGDPYDQTYIDMVRLEGPDGTAQPPKRNAATIPLTGEVKKKK